MDGERASILKLVAFVLCSSLNVSTRQPVTAGAQLCGLCYIWRKTEGVGFEILIGTLPHTDSIQSLPALSTCRRRRGENEQEQREHMNEKIDEDSFS